MFSVCVCDLVGLVYSTFVYTMEILRK